LLTVNVPVKLLLIIILSPATALSIALCIDAYWVGYTLSVDQEKENARRFNDNAIVSLFKNDRFIETPLKV
jgi:hypothetical protein